MIFKLKSLLAWAFDIGIPIPGAIGRRAERFSKYLKVQEEAQHLFESKEILYSEYGYWFVDPMPSVEELDSYYSNSYWAARDDRNIMLKDRDIAHVLQLSETHKELLLSSSNKVAVNFGAGHGGASILFHILGFRVINVDPYPIDSEYFEHFRSLTEIIDEIDIVYASHSLEHVTDVDRTMKNIIRILKPGGILFIEVPNAEHPNYQISDIDGNLRPSIQIPHTYYFTSKFFKQIGLEEIYCDSYNYGDNRSGTLDLRGKGEVIRFLGRKIG